VLPTVYASYARWTLHGRRFVFVRSRGGRSAGIWTAGANGRDLRQVTSSEYDGSPAWSPDDRRIVFVRQVPTPTVYLDRLWIVDVSGHHAHRLVPNKVGIGPDWSPNGKWVAFAGVPQDPLDGWLYVVRANGKGLHRLPWRGQYPRWSPDGKRLAFIRSTPHGYIATVVTTATNRVRAIKVDLNAPFVVWSPGGKDLLVSFWDRSAPDNEIYNVTKLRIRDGQRRFLLQHLGSLWVGDWRR